MNSTALHRVVREYLHHTVCNIRKKTAIYTRSPLSGVVRRTFLVAVPVVRFCRKHERFSRTVRSVCCTSGKKTNKIRVRVVVSPYFPPGRTFYTTRAFLFSFSRFFSFLLPASFERRGDHRVRRGPHASQRVRVITFTRVPASENGVKFAGVT